MFGSSNAMIKKEQVIAIVRYDDLLLLLLII